MIFALWNAWKTGEEWVTQDSLLEIAESDGGRVRDLFRHHPAWGAIIQSSAKVTGETPGMYRLVPPSPDEE